MVTRLAMVGLILLAADSACAESLTPDAARRFVTGKLFAEQLHYRPRSYLVCPVGPFG